MWKLNILTPKGTSLAQNTSTNHRAVTIHPPARHVGEPKKTKKGRKEERHPKQWQTGYSPRPPTSSDQNQTLHGGWPVVCSYTRQVWSKSVQGLRRCGGRKWPFPITLASGLYNSLYYRTSHDFCAQMHYGWLLPVDHKLCRNASGVTPTYITKMWNGISMTLRTTTTVEICISLHWHLHQVHFPSSWNQFYCWFKFLMTCMLEMLTMFINNVCRIHGVLAVRRMWYIWPGAFRCLSRYDASIVSLLHCCISQNVRFCYFPYYWLVFLSGAYLRPSMETIQSWQNVGEHPFSTLILLVPRRKGIWPVKILLQWQKTSGFAVINW